MPIYEFHCEKCEQDSEILVRSKDWKGTKCPHCGSARLSKKFSVFASAEGDVLDVCADSDGDIGRQRPRGGRPNQETLIWKPPAWKTASMFSADKYALSAVISLILKSAAVASSKGLN